MYPPFRPKKRWLQYWIYRIRHGFFPCDCWNLDHELAIWLVPRLKLFRANTHGYPYLLHDGSHGTWEDFDKILGEMIAGFEFKVHEWDKRTDPDGTVRYWLSPEEEHLVEKAFNHLGHYGQHLWD